MKTNRNKMRIQEVVNRRRILEEARQGMRRERVQQVKKFLIKDRIPGKLPQGRPETRVQSAFLKMFGQGQAIRSKTSTGNRGVGRPRGVFRHTSPITGKPIPAAIYYKELRAVRRHQSNLAQQRQLAIQQNMARQGITPQQAQQIELIRQLQARQMPVQQAISRPMPSQAQIQAQEMPQRSIWNRGQGQIVQDAGLFGRRLIRTGVPESFWN